MPRVPFYQRIYAVGDVHGHDKILLELLALIQKDAKSHKALRYILVFLGDYVDKGCCSREVIDILLHQLPRRMKPVFLRGNHDDRLIQFLFNNAPVSDLWVRYAARVTGRSYGVSDDFMQVPSVDRAALRYMLFDKISFDHLSFLKDTQYYFKRGNYLFVHAGIDPRKKLEEQNPDDFLRIRKGFLDYQRSFGPMVVHGHSPVSDDEPEVHINRINIDTLHGGRLTALVLQGRQRSFLRTQRNEKVRYEMRNRVVLSP